MTTVLFSILFPNAIFHCSLSRGKLGNRIDKGLIGNKRTKVCQLVVIIASKQDRREYYPRNIWLDFRRGPFIRNFHILLKVIKQINDENM